MTEQCQKLLMEETAETLNNLWQLNYTLLNDQVLKEEPQEKKTTQKLTNMDGHTTLKVCNLAWILQAKQGQSWLVCCYGYTACERVLLTNKEDLKSMI